MGDPIPGVDPVPGATRMPIEWITTTGHVRWTALRKAKGQCEDCRRLLVDESCGTQKFDRPVGAPLPAVWHRYQQMTSTYHCEDHFHAREGAS